MRVCPFYLTTEYVRGISQPQRLIADYVRVRTHVRTLLRPAVSIRVVQLISSFSATQVYSYRAYEMFHVFEVSSFKGTTDTRHDAQQAIIALSVAPTAIFLSQPSRRRPIVIATSDRKERTAGTQQQ